MEPSIFTKIINGDIPSHKIYEDDKTFAFLDIHPARPGHTLVVPKRQIDRLEDLPGEDYQALMATAHKLMKHIGDTLGVDRVCLQVMGFDVPHAHIHLLPCNNAADFHASQSEGDQEELAAMAEKLKI